MAFIKDGLNVKIFLIIVIVLVCMISLVVVFRNSFQIINSKYKEKANELNSTFVNLTGAQKELNKTLSNLELKSLSEADLRSKYTGLKNENDALNSQIVQLNSDIKVKTVKIGDLEFENSELQDKIDSLNSRITRLQDRIDCFENGNTGC